MSAAMTEQEWLACTDPTPILEFLRGKASGRKLRLFACTCCRRIWKFLADEPRGWVEIAEQYADGMVKQQELNKAEAVAKSAVGRSDGLAANTDAFSAAIAALDSMDSTSADVASTLAANAVAHERTRGQETIAGWDDAWKDERVVHTQLLRDIFGNPFRPPGTDPAWLTWSDCTVVKVAQAVYDEEVFDRLPILADALEEAGCTNADILSHCRSEGPHVRGCWVIDLILGKQ
jgi:hypothetical protein